MKQDADFYRDLRLKEMFPNAATEGKEKIDGRETYVVQAKSIDGAPERLYFEAETGLLARIAGSDPSAFGPVPYAVDYADYREVDGAKRPFRISHLKPDFSTRDEFAEVKQNVPVAREQFERPAPGAGK